MNSTHRIRYRHFVNSDAIMPKTEQIYPVASLEEGEKLYEKMIQEAKGSIAVAGGEVFMVSLVHVESGHILKGKTVRAE